MACVYNKNLLLQVVRTPGIIEEKTLNLIISKSQETLDLKLRDPSVYAFNYCETIDLEDYQIIRERQNLDINFNEFKTNLLEMLTQLQNKEMFLRCEMSSHQVCTLVFFTKSKIKSIIYLTLDLHATSQEEIINELMSNLQCVKDLNERLQIQMNCMKRTIIDKENEVKELIYLKSEMERQFYNAIKDVEQKINTQSHDVQCFLLRRINILCQKFLKTLDAVNGLKTVSYLRSDSSAKLKRTMEQLRIDNNEKDVLIELLKQENHSLQNMKMNSEKNLNTLQQALIEKDNLIEELHTKNGELLADMEKASMVIAQKKVTIEELSKDVVQANQMLVNFNQKYDAKCQLLENLESQLKSKNHIIHEELSKNSELQRAFDEYKAIFNEESYEKIKWNLATTQNKVDELEQNIRKVNRLNALLSNKVNQITH
ncbi:unnamed protein product [Diabrotica balteata]|uniref:Spindle assembly abnormal protein 6 N-terminal domain-containing protein n=1 Tax=Diabrotica balteata TaxID=107213 RepID=A0A9N9XAY8_DIABA|nr:unnamed protein product [Diabrotica balteata]